MSHFVMCPDCQAEYDSPFDRRFHAQPNACPVCGPRLEVWEGAEGAKTPQEKVTGAQGDAALRLAADALRAGQIVAVKGLGGFHLMVDARNVQAIERLRERKPRRDKPFALMVRDLEQARSLCDIPAPAVALLTSAESPIVLLQRRIDAPIAENVAPANPTLGVMLPYTPLHHLLLCEIHFPVVATSGNLTDEPICTDEQEAVQRLGHIADLFLVHNRPVERHVDDSVAWIVQAQPQLLRRARGYAPLPVLLTRSLPTILAVGAHLKNTVALSVERQVFISQHIGDLETPEAMHAFERVIADFLRLYEAAPVAIAHDMHPDYLSTRQAVDAADSALFSHLDTVPRLISVQHHHAHLASCLAEHGIEGTALGVTWDGTGYGTDGTIWGGEFLLGDAAGYTRVAYLRPFRLPGGAAAVREPRRVAVALLWECFNDALLDAEDAEDILVKDNTSPVQSFSPDERRMLVRMLRQGINTPVTTSAGRLFDGIAALIGLDQRVSFEGQAAMALEFTANPDVQDAYPLIPRKDQAHSAIVLDWVPLLEMLLADLRREVKPGMIAAKFHNALVEAIAYVAQAVGEPRVALTGGCFQNRLLTERTAQRLRGAGFEVLLQRQVPPNDGGIALGQVVVAARQLEGNI
jgi:hydrogenase maturation protein HypF